MKRKIPIYLTEQEQEELLRAPDRKRTQNGLRNYCIMLLMLQAGLRCGEVINLAITDINWTSGELKIREGKGGKDRIVFLNHQSLDTLRDYLQKNRQNKNTDTSETTNLMFFSSSNIALDPSYVRRMVKHYGQKAGIKKDIHPHTLRHTFATHFYRKTKNLMMLSKVLGHSNISTTQIYTHIVDEELESSMKEYSVMGK